MSSLIPIVSVDGVDKAELLALLYAEAKAFNEAAVVPMTRGDADKILQTETIFRNFKGKRLWVDLSSTTVHFYWYDRHNGLGKGRAVLKKLLDKMTYRSPANPDIQERRNIKSGISNTTGDFIPNPITPSQQSASHMRNKNMNGVIAAKAPKVVDTSQIYNAATQRQRVQPVPKKVQVINSKPRAINLNVQPENESAPNDEQDTSVKLGQEKDAASGDVPTSSDPAPLFQRRPRRQLPQ